MALKRSGAPVTKGYEDKNKRAKRADGANPDIVPSADAAPQTQLIAPAPAPASATNLNETSTNLPCFTVTQLNLERVHAKKDANKIVYLALVKKPKPTDSPASGPECLNIDVGMEVTGFPKLTCLLVRNSFLSCHALIETPAPINSLPPTPVSPTTSVPLAHVPPTAVTPTPVASKPVPIRVTATKVIVDDLQYRVTSYLNQKFCLATYDFNKEGVIYDYSLKHVQDTMKVRLTVWKRPVCRHPTAAVPELPCKQCEQEVTEKHFVEVPLADLRSPADLYGGNWGEVRTGAWIEARFTSTTQCPDSVFEYNLSEVLPEKEVVTKRVYNVIKSEEPTDKSQSYFIEFMDLRSGRGSLWHECCVPNPNDVKDSHSLVKYFEKRSVYKFTDNVMREVEIMHYLGGHERRFVELDSFGIDMHNLYVNSKLLSADLHDLLKRVENERVTEVTAKRIMRRLLESTDYMHGRSVVHLDFKSNNIAFCPTVVPTAELHDFISAVSCSSPVKNFPEKYFQYLEAVILDFGHAEWQPRAAADAEDPLKNKKRRDLQQLGRIFSHMIEGTNISCDPDALCERLRAAPDKLLSDEGIHCLQNLLKEPEYTAAQALQLPWFDTN